MSCREIIPDFFLQLPSLNTLNELEALTHSWYTHRQLIPEQNRSTEIGLELRHS